MKIAISGPPGSGKTQLYNELKRDPWFLSKGFLFSVPEFKHLIDPKENMSQMLVFNEMVKSCFFTNSLNSFHKFSIIDPVAAFIDAGGSTAMSSAQFLSSSKPVLNKYDYIFILGDSKDPKKYDLYQKVSPGKDNLVYLFDLNHKQRYNKIINLVKEKYGEINEQKFKDSNQWFTAFREDYATKFPSSSSEV